MERFETIVMKLGEHGVQSILENWERYSGMRPAGLVSLEDRWEAFLRHTDSHVARVAA